MKNKSYFSTAGRALWVSESVFAKWRCGRQIPIHRSQGPYSNLPRSMMSWCGSEVAESDPSLTFIQWSLVSVPVTVQNQEIAFKKGDRGRKGRENNWILIGLCLQFRNGLSSIKTYISHLLREPGEHLRVYPHKVGLKKT